MRSTRRADRAELFGEPVGAWARRLLLAAGIFLIAFLLDMSTGQRYSAAWGSIAIVVSIPLLLPTLRPALGALGTYVGIWLGFNAVRAVADDAALTLADIGAISRVERALFDGHLPAAWLQDRLFDPNRIDALDVALTIVHLSFFIAPFLMAIVIWRQRRSVFRTYAVATAIAFALGLVGFVLLPTAPPWLSDPDDVQRVSRFVVASAVGREPNPDDRLWFEPNHLAAMPSVHVAAAVLVGLTLCWFGRAGTVIGALYAVAMSVAVVYLGEHFVLDAVFGWVIALAGWRAAAWWDPAFSWGRVSRTTLRVASRR